MSNGWIKVHRKIKESEIWETKPAWWTKVWLYILIRVNHMENSKFKPGENWFTYRKIYVDCGLSNEHIKENAVDNVIRYLKKRRMCTTRRTTRGFAISVCNWKNYQGLFDGENDTEDDRGNDRVNDNRTVRIPHDKQEEKKLRKKKEEYFGLFWKKYPKKRSKKETLNYWLKMSDNDTKEALTNVDRYVKSQSDPKYVVDPIRYLRNRRWEDEAPGTTEKKTEYGPLSHPEGYAGYKRDNPHLFPDEDPGEREVPINVE